MLYFIWFQSPELYYKYNKIFATSIIKKVYAAMIKKNNNKIKILFFDTWPNLGGAQLAIFDIANSLDKNIFTSEFCALLNGPFLKKCSESGFYVFHLNYSKNFYGLKKKNKIYTILNFILFFIISIWKIIFFLFQIKKRNIKIIYCNNILAVLFSIVPKLFLQIKIIWHIHFNFRTELYYFYKVGIYFSNKIISLSNLVKNQFQSLSADKEKIITIYNSLTPDFINFSGKKILLEKYNLSNDVIIIGTVGRIVPIKGIEYFIKSSILILEKYPQCRFFIVGAISEKNIDYYNYLQNLIKDANIEDKIFFTGFYDKIAEVINSFDIFVLPSLNENFGRVLIEAQYFEKPLIATKVGGIPEAVIENETGFLVEPENETVIAEKILFLLANPEKAKIMGMKGKEFVEKNFLMERNIKKFENLFLSV